MISEKGKTYYRVRDGKILVLLDNEHKEKKMRSRKIRNRKEMNQEINNLYGHVDFDRRDRSKISTRVESLTTKHEALEGWIQHVENRLDNRVRELEETIENLRQQIVALGNRVAQLETDNRVYPDFGENTYLDRSGKVKEVVMFILDHLGLKVGYQPESITLEQKETKKK